MSFLPARLPRMPIRQHDQFAPDRRLFKASVCDQRFTAVHPALAAFARAIPEFRRAAFRCAAVAAPCNGHGAPLCFVVRAGTREERTMGLLDVLNGMQNGPRGPSNPSAQAGGGMSPLTMAILALLAYKAVKHLSGSQPGAARRRRLAGHCECRPARRRNGRRSWRHPQGRIGRPARGRRRRQRDQRRARRPAQAIPAERPGRGRQFMGEPGPEQADFARRSRPRPWAPIRSIRCRRKADCRATSCSPASASICPTVIDHLTPDGRLPTESELSGRILIGAAAGFLNSAF